MHEPDEQSPFPAHGDPSGSNPQVPPEQVPLAHSVPLLQACPGAPWQVAPDVKSVQRWLALHTTPSVPHPHRAGVVGTHIGAIPAGQSALVVQPQVWVVPQTWPAEFDAQSALLAHGTQTPDTVSHAGTMPPQSAALVQPQPPLTHALSLTPVVQSTHALPHEVASVLVTQAIAPLQQLPAAQFALLPRAGQLLLHCVAPHE